METIIVGTKETRQKEEEEETDVHHQRLDKVMEKENRHEAVVLKVSQEQGLQINHQEVHPVAKVKGNHRGQEEKCLKVQETK